MITERQLARFRGQQQGQPCEIREVPIESLTLADCQRMLDQQHAWQCVRRSGGLDWFKFQPLDVVRKSTGELRVINGQHRLEMLKMVLPERETVQCRIIDCDDDSRAAQLFADFNARGIKKVKDTDLLWAEIIAKDTRALATLRALEQCDLSVGRVREGQAKQSVELASFRTAVKWGLKETERAVELYRRAWPTEKTINGDVLTGMVRLLTLDHYRADLAADTAYGQAFDQWFVAVFQHLSPNRAKYVEYRNAQTGLWSDGVAWGLLEDFSASQLQKGRGYPSKKFMQELHGNTRRTQK